MANGGQVLLSQATAGIVDDEEIAGVSLRDLGEYRLKDFDRPERIFQLVVDGLPSEFPPLTCGRRTASADRHGDDRYGGGAAHDASHKRAPPRGFLVVLSEYQRLLSRVLREMGGRAVEVEGDSVAAGFATAKEAALAAAAAQRAVAAHEWPYGLGVAISVGMHSGEAGIGWLGPAIWRCTELCDAAEGGQVFLSQATASLLEDVNLGELVIRDVGEREMRRTRGAVRAYELVLPSTGETTG